ncbi:BZ3500_MvSof-1268-A1-R1_Chr11-1g03229 [Microbotryum saponariae]|uniref:Phosphatidyl-N-methylethanolamine N-methyltransferase n=1 Tax=Microbotryum saponariae TaxID=289078 RepID=A0A2X0LUL4_9BASI|nr:BZ3501_MvSof-1269-A2-R1_Chr11g02804 [Microbotryum saponariae]SDA03789.1 BZ3500_MvSof-1268-A1-R1_Chr11-1g03229 [Microbotryum saponariae]
MAHLIKLDEPSLWIATASIIFNPLFWNIVARQEHKNKILTKLAFGKPYLGCYALALTIFSLGILRDHLYATALSQQPKWYLLHYTEVKIVAALAFLSGGVLVASSMWALGVTGTYLGDYFGILMDEKVESFPFNVTDNPMYYGSTLSFLGTALWYESFAGLLLTALVFVEYKIALTYEEPFTGAIYAAREAARSRKGSKTGSAHKSITASGSKDKEL